MLFKLRADYEPTGDQPPSCEVVKPADPKVVSAIINELIGPVEYEKTNHDFFGAKVSEVYRLYQKRLREFDAMDFDDLIGKYVRRLLGRPGEPSPPGATDLLRGWGY